MSMNVKPLGFRVLVEQLENRQLGHIVAPTNTQEAAFCRYVVVDVGEQGVMMNGEKCDIPCKIGDEIMFNLQRAMVCGPPYLFGGRKLAIVEADAIMAVLSGEPDMPAPQIVRATAKQKQQLVTN